MSLVTAIAFSLMLSAAATWLFVRVATRWKNLVAMHEKGLTFGSAPLACLGDVNTGPKHDPY